MEQKPEYSQENRQDRGNRPFLRERHMFRLLLQSNANYFGTLPGSLLPVKKPICCNSYYEEIAKVAWDRKAHRLAAVIVLHQAGGYAGGTRMTRAPEYLRFYVSLDGGEHWQDQGLASVDVENAPSGGDRHHAVSLQPLLSEDELRNAEVRVRVILAWEDIPPPDRPDWQPVFGDIHETVYPPAGKEEAAHDRPLLAAGLNEEHQAMLLTVVRLTREERNARRFRYLGFWLASERDGPPERCLGSLPLSPDNAEQILEFPLNLPDCRWVCAANSRLLDLLLVLSPERLDPGRCPATGDDSIRMTRASLSMAPRVKAGAGEIALVGGCSARDLHVAELQLNSAREGGIIIQGVPMEGHRYVVEASDDGLNWHPLSQSFMVTDDQGNRTRHRPDPDTGQFQYLPHEKNVLGILAHWEHPGSGKWQLRLRVYMQGILLPHSDRVLVRIAEDPPGRCGAAVVEDAGPVVSGMHPEPILSGILVGTGFCQHFQW